METLVGKGTHQKTPELEGLIADGMYYLHEAIHLYGNNPGIEVVLSFSSRFVSKGVAIHPEHSSCVVLGR